MKKLKNAFVILTSLIAILGLAGCLGGGNGSATPQASLGQAAFTSLELITYDQLIAKMRLKGALNVTGATGLNAITIYTDSQCVLSPVGQGLAQDLTSNGIEIQIPSTNITKIYLKTNTVSDCFYMTEHLPNYGAPPPPVFVSTSPTSPTRASYEPLVIGTVSAATTAIRLFDDVGCAHQVGGGNPATFSTVGLIASLQPDTINKIFAVATDAFGKPSACTLLGNFIHSSLGAATPAFASMTPVSPSSTVLNPVLVGTVGPDSATVGIYSDAACSVLVKSGTADEFRTTGLELLAAENSTTNFYARSIDTGGLASDCSFLSIYVHDSVAPLPPVFVSASPSSPTRTTLVPRVKGTASSDSATVRIFNNSNCTTQVGSGTKVVFEGTGISSAIQPNEITTLYAAGFDAAGNSSACTVMTTYVHDTIAPDPPIFAATIPAAPNNFSTTPFVEGTADSTTVTVELFKDETCSLLAGSGGSAAFPNPGIQVTLTGNTTTTIYGHAIDEAGNISQCSALTNYAHSTAPAPAPNFFQAIPSSPTRISTTPYIVGTAANIVSRVTLYGDNLCTTTLGNASKSVFVTTGIQASLVQDAQNSIYAISQDVYGNVSACTFLTSYIHDSIAPFDPIFSSISPLSPNSISITPTINGSVTVNPAKVLPVSAVNLYDSFLCLNRIGLGTPASLSGAGIQASVGENAETSIYARSFDAAGNMSNCTLFSNYIHDALIPGRPVLSSITPMTPSYTSETTLLATIGPTTDFLPATSLVIYSDASCSTIVSNGAPALAASTGLSVNVAKNATTTIYGAAFNVVGTSSPCTQLIDYKHSDVGPIGLSSIQGPDGSVTVSWTPDSIARPIPTYTIRRSVIDGGPYTTISIGANGTSFRDSNVTNGATYYYVVAASNNTGVSKNSAQTSITVNVSVPSGPLGLTATSGPTEATLNWSGFSSAMSYKIFRSTQSGGPYSTIVTKQVSTTYIDSALTDGSTYFYVVEGTNPAGDSVMSNEASVVPLGVPAPPTNFSIVPVLSTPACGGGAGVVLSWTAPSYYSTFGIGRATSAGATSPYNSSAGTSFVDCSPSNYNSTYLGTPNYNYYDVSARWGSLSATTPYQVAFVNDPGPVLKINPGSGHNKVSWASVAGALKYHLYRAIKSQGPYTLLSNSIATTSYTDSSLTNGQAYFYIAYAEYNSGITGWPSLEASGMPGVDPSAPTNLVVTTGTGKTPILNWSAPAVYNSFNVYRAAAIGGPYSYLAQTPTATFSDASPLTSLNYYKVTAAWGSFETSDSNIVVFRNGIPTTVTITPAASDITLSWTAIGGTLQYSVMRAQSSGGPYTVIATPGTNSFIDTAVVINVGYFYVIRAEFADGTLAPTSGEVSAMITTSARPEGLTVTSTSNSGVDLAWAAVKNATTYRMYQASLITGPFTLIQTISTNVVSISGLSGQTDYFFRVTSVKSGTESSPSTAVKATTRTGPSAPQVIAGSNLVTVTWGSVVNALSYEITRSTDGTTFTTLVSGLTVTTYNDTTATNGILYFYRIVAQFSPDTLESANSLGVTPGVAPRVPSGLTVIGNSTGTDVDLAWSTVSGASSYKIYAATVSGGPYVLASTTTTFSGITVSGLTSGTRYYFAVTSLIGAVESAKSTEVSAIPLSTPNAPIVTTVGVTISVSWSGVAGAATFNILRSSDRSTYATLVTGNVSTTYVDAAIVNGATYTYKHQPVDSTGVLMSISQPSATITPGLAPETPQNLKANSAGTTSIALSWIAVPNASTYTLSRGTSTGGPYSFVATINSPTTTYTDAGLSAGGTYFYVLTSNSSSAVPSANSNEASVTLAAAPSSLVATAQLNSIQLTWTAAGGAASYRVLRGETSGGPYGLIGSPTAATYSDTTVANGITYYYIVTAMVSGVASRSSNEASAVGNRAMNLQVPIELTDQGMGSDTTTITFERTRTSMNTNNYDGTPTYYFEIVAQNSETAAYDVLLVDSAGTTVATANVTANLYSPKRIRVSMTPTAGSNTYRVKFPATPMAGSLQVFSARMLINQTNATKTKIYVPLLTSLSGIYSGDSAGNVESSNASNYNELSSASIYRRDTSKLATLAAQNAWELETIVGASGTAVGAVALLNSTTSTVVGSTETIYSGAGPALVRSPFPEGASSFDSSTENHNYQVSIRCAGNCTTGQAVLYKAGLWIRITQMDKVQVYFRNSFGSNVLSASILESQRTYMDLSLFSNPIAYFQRVGYLQGASPATIDLVDLQLADVDTTGATMVTNSDSSELSNSKLLNRSPALTLTNTHRFAPRVTPDSSPYRHVDSAIVINSVR